MVLKGEMRETNKKKMVWKKEVKRVKTRMMSQKNSWQSRLKTENNAKTLKRIRRRSFLMSLMLTSKQTGFTMCS